MILRAFVAAFPSRVAQERIYESIPALRAAHRDRGHRWVPFENYHITFCFVGSIEIADVSRLQVMLEPLARATHACACVTEGVHILPNEHHARVVALSIASRGALESLAARVHTALAPTFPDADRTFLPHLTVIRCNTGARAMPGADHPRIEFTLGSLGLYRSDTHPAGPRYTPLFELPLRQPPEEQRK